MVKIILCLIAILFLSKTHAFDPAYIRNNKESESRILKRSHHYLAIGWAQTQGDRSLALLKAKSFLANVLAKMAKRDAVCDLGMLSLMEIQGVGDNTLRSPQELNAVLAFLRIENQIDDLLYENILNSQKLSANLLRAQHRGYPNFPPVNRYNDSSKDVDVTIAYKEFKTWPDDIQSCSLGAYYRLAMSLTWKNTNERDRILKRLNYHALEKKVITAATYQKLETFRTEKALDWSTHLANYMDIIKNAKDKLSSTGKPVMDPATHSTKYADRKNQLTHREQLYKNFSSTQIMLLSNIIEKTAKRMDAKNVSIYFRYFDDPDPSEIYVLSPLEKYRLALKMLRKDLAEAMRSETFAGKTINYEDLVTAAYETGYVKSNELELILKFEDFWNPTTPRWKVYANFAFSLLGTATWFLPPPFNIVGALALVVTQSKVGQGDQPVDPDENWNVVLKRKSL